jgi:hypothetical protein
VILFVVGTGTTVVKLDVKLDEVDEEMSDGFGLVVELDA